VKAAKSQDEAEDQNAIEDTQGMPCGAKVLKELLEPWVDRERRYFIATARSVGAGCNSGNPVVVDGTSVWSCVGPHLTSTKKKRRRKDDTATNHLHQGNCTVCSSKTFFVCSMMLEGGPGEDCLTHLCGTKTFRPCFASHLKKKHEYGTP
jgi:hypothetical protein